MLYTRRSKRRSVIGAVLLCMGLAAIGQVAWAAEPTYHLQSVRGTVQVQRSGQGAWLAVKRSSITANVNDRIRTGANSSVQIVTSTGQRVAMGASSEVILREPNKPSGWRVLAGKVLAVFTGGNKLEIRAPGAVAAAEGTIFQILVAIDGTTVLTVLEGIVRFHNDLGSVKVAESEESTAVPGSAPTRPAVVDPSGTVAWEASLQTLIIEPEYPHVGTDPETLLRTLESRAQALQTTPDAATAAGVVQVLLDLGRTDDAQSQVEAALATTPADATLQGLLGFALLQAGRPEEAGAALQAAADAAPTDARWQTGLGLIALAQRDAGPAVAMLTQAAQLAPTDAVPMAYLAGAHLRMGDLAAAATAATAAVSIDPTNHLANSYLAYVRLAQGDVDAAVAAGAIAVDNAPASGAAHEALGTAQFFGGNLNAARDSLSEALRLAPLSAGAHLTMAKLLAADDDIDAALGEAETAVGLNPQSAPARSTLGLLFLLNKDEWRAGREFEIRIRRTRPTTTRRLEPCPCQTLPTVLRRFVPG